MNNSNNDMELKIAKARDFARRILSDNFNCVHKDDYFMFQISKFLLLKESMIKKDSDNNQIYFNVVDNQEYLKSIIYIVDYVRNHGILISNNVDVVILPAGYKASKELKSYIRDFHKIRDSIAHGGYYIDSTNGCIVLDNSNLKPGDFVNSSTYVIRGKLPIEVLELFTFIFTKPKYVYSKKEIDEFKTEVETKRKQYGFSGEIKYNVYNTMNEYNNINNNLFKYDAKIINNDIYNDNFDKYNNFLYNKDKLNIINDTYEYKYNDNNEIIIKTARKREKLLQQLIRELINDKKLSTGQKIKILKYLQKYGLIDSNVYIDNILVKTNKHPDKSYVDKLAFVITEISSIIGMGNNLTDIIKVSSVYNYMQLFLSFKQESINSKDKMNLGKLKVSRINPKYYSGMKSEYEQKIFAIRKYVKEEIIGEFKNKGNRIGKIEQYTKHPSKTFRDSINNLLKQHYLKLLSYLASRNIDIITSIRNSLEHGNVEEEAGNIILHDQSNQNNSATKNFECIGSPNDFYEIVSCIDLDQEQNFTFDDFMAEMKYILEEDMFNEFNEIVESIKKINTEALVNTLKQVSVKK